MATERSNEWEIGEVASTGSAIEPSPDLVAEPRMRGRECRLGLIGLPNSGKTSWLYALVNGAANHARGHRRWLRGPLSRRFNDLTSQGAGGIQSATPAGVFTQSRFCEMVRPWVPFLNLGTRCQIVIPEVSGETVRQIAAGAELKADSAEDRYLDFLAKSDSIVCLVGLDGEHGMADGTLRPDHALVQSLVNFERILGETMRRRGKRATIAVSVLLTKVDLLKQHPRLDVISLPRTASSVAARLESRRHRGLASLLTQAGEGTSVSFRVSSLMGAEQARGDLDLQECIAADFLKCHARRAAEAMSKLCQLPGLDVRFFLCAPYGRTSVNEQNQSIYPAPGELRSFMSFEPLEDVLERAWQQRTGGRVRRNVVAAGMIAAAIAVLGPGLAFWNESRFDAAVESRDHWEQTDRSLASIEEHWLSRLERAVSPVMRSRHASRLLEVRERMLAGEVSAGDYRIADLEMRAFRLDPQAVIASSSGTPKPLRTLVVDRGRRWLEAYVRGEVAIPVGGCDLELNGEAVIELVLSIGRVLEQRRTPDEWRALGERARPLLDSFRNPEAASIRLRCSDLGPLMENAVERMIATSQAQVVLASLGDLPSQEVEQTRLDLDAAARSGLLEPLRAMDRVLLESASSRWESWKAPRAAGEGSPDLSTAVAASERWPWMDHLRRSAAQAALWSWVGSRADRLLEEIRRAEQSPQGLTLENCGILLAEMAVIEDGLAPYRAERDRWMLGDGGGRLREGLAAFRARDEVIREASNPRASARALGPRVREVFSRDPQLVASAGGVQIDLRPVLAAQTRLAEQAFAERFDAAVADGNDVEATAELDAWAAVRSSREDGRDVAAAARAAWESAEVDRPDRETVVAALRRALAQESDAEFLAVPLARRMGRAKAVADVIPIAVDVAIDGAMSDPSRRRWVDALLEATPSEAWSTLDGATLSRMYERLVSAGADRERVARALLRVPLRMAVADAVPARRQQAQEASLTLLRRVAADGVSIDNAVLAPLITSLRDHVLESPDGSQLTSVDSTGGRAIALARALLAEGLASESLGSIIADVERHAALVSEWRLRKVRSNDGAFWLGEHEWTEEETTRLAVSRSLEWRAAVTAGLPFEVDGRRIGRSVSADESPANLRLPSRASAELLLRTAGLRLPSSPEWLAAYGEVPAPLVFDESKLGSRWDTSPTALRRMGDVSTSGIVGLRFGVREWVSDRDSPQGWSNANQDKPPEDVVRFDVGVRPALDGLPGSLIEWSSGEGASPHGSS